MDSISSYPYTCLLPEGKTFLCHPESQTSFASAPEDNDFEGLLSEHNNKETVQYSSSGSPIMTLSHTELGRHLRFEYISHVQFESSKVMHYMPYNIPDELRESTIDTLDEKVLQLVRTGMHHPSLLVKHVGMVDAVDMGHGLFTTTQIPAKTFLGEYVGILSTSSLEAGETDYCCQYPTCDGGTYINAKYCGNVIRFVNHSTTPNVAFENFFIDGICHVLCFTLLAVAAGDELSVDYGPSYWLRSTVTKVDR